VCVEVTYWGTDYLKQKDIAQIHGDAKIRMGIELYKMSYKVVFI